MIRKYVQADRAMQSWVAWVRAGRPRYASTGDSIFAAVARAKKVGASFDRMPPGPREPRGFVAPDASPELVDVVIFGGGRSSGLERSVATVLIARYSEKMPCKLIARQLGICQRTYYHRLASGLKAIEDEMHARAST